VDIEFLTQMLQLTYGLRFREVRKRATLQALKALHERGILKKTEYQILYDGYLFLRRLDHRLRLEHDQSIDAFEAEPERLAGIAHALGYNGTKPSLKTKSKSGQKLLHDYVARRDKIRACYARYFLPKSNSEA
jgi:[glutamine synthetase] adenylyltransferase / [glutamine synthetase]-adenylyl-L-tyrosine phosphorylase